MSEAAPPGAHGSGGPMYSRTSSVSWSLVVWRIITNPRRKSPSTGIRSLHCLPIEGGKGQAQAMFDALPEYQGYLAEFLTLGVLGVVIYK